MRIEDDEANRQEVRLRSSRDQESEAADDSEEAAARAGSSAAAMGAYLEAMRGEDGHQIGAKGGAKFNKTQGKRARGAADDDDHDDGADVPVTRGIRELEVETSGSKRKKAKRETERIGGEFKAKVRQRVRFESRLGSD